ncbi:alpha-ketoglutarate dehydrogenase component 4 [Periplaneta americana]|uniref:alpha-ketoglutarate dehydrogenase component 4 n=1 Tax=Periplaneta americana TaxID=6978 RepID=UPI0037E7DCE1
MASAFVSRAWQTIKPHVPLIKFRKGGLSAVDPRSTGAETSSHSGGSAGGGKKAQFTSRPVIEDYQLPLRYRRQPLDEKEIAYINRGGPE